MNDMELNLKNMGIDACMTLSLIDTYINMMKEKDIKLIEIAVYVDHWEVLNSSITYWHKEEGYNLKTHTYRGVKITSETNYNRREK
jgi:hypothetical protein